MVKINGEKDCTENIHFLVTFFMDNVLIMQELYKRVCAILVLSTFKSDSDSQQNRNYF